VVNFKKILALALIMVIVLIGIFGYLAVMLRHISSSPSPIPAEHNVTTALYSSMISQNMLFYNQNSSVFPYSLLFYDAANVPYAILNVSLLASLPPSNVYMLNYSNDCFNCGNSFAAASAIENDLVSYGVVNSESSIGVLSKSDLQSINNDSLLIIINGLMPSYMFEYINGTNETILQYLLNRGTSIIYVGQSFSRLVLPGGVVVPNSNNLPFLSTFSTSLPKTSTFYFSNATFGFTSGGTYGTASYANIFNGSIIAFSNYLNSWRSPAEAGSDIAKAAAQEFWIPKYASDTQLIPVGYYQKRSGNIGIILNKTEFAYNSTSLPKLNSGYLRVALYNNMTYNLTNASIYKYYLYVPDYSINGSISIPSDIIPGQSTPATLEVFTRSSIPISIQPHLSIYTANMSMIETLPLQFFSAYGNFTFLKYLTLQLPPGKYIARLESFSNMQYAAALFQVPSVKLSMSNANFSSNVYRIAVSSGGMPISGVNYSISVNGLYKSSGVISNGTLYYALPSGSPKINGNATFSISMLSKNFTYVFVRPSTAIKISSQYIELAVVAIIVLMMVTLVRAPNRDEFYIDVPNLPRQDKIPIKLKPNEVIGVFDKLNSYYHWKYMPLSKNEVRMAIATNLRKNNMPINLTYNNVDVILSQLVEKNELASIDDLYAPKAWIDASKHDIEYLAVFKKLRLYFVSHALIFSDLDSSTVADMTIASHGEKIYIVIFSPTSRFKNIPVYSNSITYIAFINEDRLEEFKDSLYSNVSPDVEQLKLYISAGMIRLINVDNPDDIRV
jgi:hypothetical protein